MNITGEQIKRDNGSGYSLAQEFPGRRFHDRVTYRVSYRGVGLDRSTVRTIVRERRAEFVAPGI